MISLDAMPSPPDESDTRGNEASGGSLPLLFSSLGASMLLRGIAGAGAGPGRGMSCDASAALTSAAWHPAPVARAGLRRLRRRRRRYRRPASGLHGRSIRLPGPPQRAAVRATCRRAVCAARTRRPAILMEVRTTMPRLGSRRRSHDNGCARAAADRKRIARVTPVKRIRFRRS